MQSTTEVHLAWLADVCMKASQQARPRWRTGAGRTAWGWGWCQPTVRSGQAFFVFSCVETAKVEGWRRKDRQACDLWPSSKHRHPRFKYLFGCLVSPSANNNEKNSKGHYQEPRVTAREAEMGLHQSQRSFLKEAFAHSGGRVYRGHLSVLSDLVLEALDKEAASGTGQASPCPGATSSPPMPLFCKRLGEAYSVGVSSGPNRARTGWESWLFEMCYCFPWSPDGSFKGHCVCVAFCVAKFIRHTTG